MRRNGQNGRLRPLPDYLRRGLDLVFIGFNPGLRSARLGHYYAGPTNLFWSALSESGLVPEQLTFEDDSRLPDFNLGLTDIVKHPSRGSADLRPSQYRRGRERLAQKIRRCRPRALAFVGKGVYEEFFGHKPRLGPQSQTVFGARVFVLPSTSGANAGVSRRTKRAWFRRLARWLQRNPQTLHTGRT